LAGRQSKAVKPTSTGPNVSGPRRRLDLSHAPEHSLLFEKVIPALLILMGILTLLLILFAAGVLLGIVHF
jgi:hypothetical protein